MADKMIFPIGFDLEAAVKGAGDDWDKKYAKRLEDLIAKRPVNVKLTFDTTKLDSLDAVKKRLAELKIEPITPETKTAIKELARELNQLARAMEAVSKYTISRGMASPDAVRAARIAEIDARRNVALERQRKLQADVRIKEERLALAREKAARAAERGATATRNANREIQAQDGYVSRLLKRLAVYASFNAVGTFLTNVREVTAQFELQRVSLGAIIQDQARANQLFSEIKTFALKSPISIMDLTKYTKQVAAYGIETEKLFGTTKMLADISVGLGVSLDRLALFYGQVYATGYLRASEVRQATEAGIPLVEKLAEKISQANGELVSAAQVMDMISKRAVSFELVEEVFQDMTSAGGMFYNMQEKQGETLAGMWAKLGDAASVMYDQIGNTSMVNSAMKTTIGLLTDFMRNWKEVAGTIGGLGIGLALTKGLNVFKGQLATIEATRVAASKRLAVTQEALNAVIRKGAIDNEVYAATGRKVYTTEFIRAKAARDVARAELMAANATTVWSKAWNKLKAAFMGNWVGLLLTAVAAIVTHFLMAEDAAARLKNTLADLNAESERETAESVSKFKILADRAVEAADGSKAQKDALDELKNTYGQIIPYEYLTIENLSKMKGEYGELTTMIEEYNAKLKLTNAQNAITEEYAPKEKDRRTKLRKLLTEKGFDLETEDNVFVQEIKFNPVTTQKFFNELDEISKKTTDKSKAISEAVKAIWGDLDLGPLWEKQADGTEKINKNFEAVVSAMENFDRHELEGQGTMMDYVEALIEKNQLLQQEQDNYDKAAASLNQYTAIVDELQKKIQDKGTEKFTDDESYSAYLENEKSKLQDVYNAIRDVVQNESKEIILANNELVKQFGEGTITYGDLLDKLLELPLSAKANAAIKAIQKIYTQLAPTDQTVVVYREKFSSLANTMEVSMFRVQKSQMKQGQTLEEHRKVITGEIDTINKKILQLVATKKLMTQQGYDTTDIEKQLETEKKLLEFYNTYLGSIPNFDKKKNKGSGSKSDPRLNNLKEEISLTKKLYDEYKKLEKQIGATRAAEKIQEIYSNTIKTLQGRAKKYGFTFELPFTDENLKANMQQFINKMKELQKLTDKKGKPLFPNIGKDIDEAVAQLEDVDFNSLQKALEKKLKELSDRISRTKTAREFYDKILSQTGNIELAASVSMSIYGDDGFELQQQMAQQIQQMFSGFDIEVPVSVIGADNNINYLELEKFVRSMEKELGGVESKTYQELLKIAQQGQKDLAKTYEGYFKDLEKAKTYADKRVELARTTAEKIRKINADIETGNISEAIGKKTIRELIDKETNEAAKLEYEAFKETPLYVQMFEDLEHASTTTLETMRKRLKALSRTWGSALDPTQLKEMQSRMKEITEQLRNRNPFKALKEAYTDYKNSIKDFTLKGAVEKSGEASKRYYQDVQDYGADSKQALAAERELKVRQRILEMARSLTDENGKLLKGQKALDKAQIKANDNLKIARGLLENAVAEEQDAIDKATKEGRDPAKDPSVIAANKRVEAAKEEVEVAQEVASTVQETVQTSMILQATLQKAAQMVGQMLDWAGDIARGVADISEALGADEEDVQYWNTVADSLSDIAGGIQDIVNAATSGDVIGMVSSVLTAIPKMFVGFVNLFSANRIRKANKEIERQQELLDQLEYSYGRLEKAADKLFGKDYINNFEQQQKNLQAQAEAYRKQAEAERSKGKKADKNKIKEYENAYRDTMDEIADMQSQLIEKFTGTSKTDAAKQMAQSWLEAKASLSDTYAAIYGDYSEMIKNMIVEGMAAKVIENALTPMWDKVDKMLADNDVNGAIDALVGGMDSALNAANNGMEVLWQALESKGYDLKKLIGDVDSSYTGIKREVAGATSEEMNANTAALNAQNYYVSHLPGIAANVALIRQIMEIGNASAVTTTTAAGWTDWQQQAMDHYAAIQRNTADTVVECRRAAIAAENAASQLQRVISTKGNTRGFNVWMKS